MDSDNPAAGAPSTDVDLHLRVVGAILENYDLYREPRLEAVKDMVLQSMAQLRPEAATIRRLQEVLCFNDVPLVSENVLREAVNDLNRQGQIERVSKAPKSYRLAVEVPPREGRVAELIRAGWSRHFAGLESHTERQFASALATVFARYGCSAYETLTSREPSPVRVDEVLASILLDDQAKDAFRESFLEFVASPHPADADLKLRLASGYALLRMNGAGNWDAGELRKLFENKTFLLDTNVLFELIDRNISQVVKLFQETTSRGAKLKIAQETVKEFETALRSTASQVAAVVARGVDIRKLVEDGVVHRAWVRALVEDNTSITREDVDGRVENLLAQVDGMIDACGIERVYLMRTESTPRRLKRVEEVQRLALEYRHFLKKEEVALHDALLWEAVEEEPRLGHHVLTLDRSLSRIRVKGALMAVMFDDVMACTLLGGINPEELSEVFNHTLSQDLCPDGTFLRLDDIHTISTLEATLLTGPTRMLRRAAHDIAQMRAEKFRSGQAISTSEVGRIMTSTLSKYREDRAIAQSEREQRLAAEGTAARLSEQVAELSADSEAKAELEKRLARLERRLSEAEDSNAGLSAAAEEKDRVVSRLTAEVDEHRASKRKLRDWVLFGVFAMLASVVLAILSVKWAFSICVITAGLVLAWALLAEDTPRISLVLVSTATAIVIAIVAVVEKWAAVAPLLGSSVPPPSAASSARTGSTPPSASSARPVER